MTFDIASGSAGEGATDGPSAPRVRPWVLVLTAVLILLFAAPWILLTSRLAGIPELGEPFDIEAFRRIRVDPAENAAVDYAEAIR